MEKSRGRVVEVYISIFIGRLAELVGGQLQVVRRRCCIGWWALACALLGVSVTSQAQQVTIPLWPTSIQKNSGEEASARDITKPSDRLTAGKRVMRLTDIGQPSLSVFRPEGADQEVPAILVFPGGGYQVLAYDLEGTEVCDWLNSLRITCVLVKYRVPIKGRYPARTEDLDDAQQALRLTWQNAAAWRIDKTRIGALGFSAGGHLVAALSNHPAVAEHHPAAALQGLRPAFAVILYPGYLAVGNSIELAPGVSPSKDTPPTFLLQTEDDPVGAENVMAYFTALKAAKVSAELHIYAEGGHGYGLRPTAMPVTHWPALAEQWFRSIHVLDR